MSQIRNTIKEFIQKAKSSHPTVAEKVIEEVDSLLEETLGSKEMRTTEIDNIAERLINFQIEQDRTIAEEHED